MAKNKQRRNEESGLVQKSIWLFEDDIDTLRKIGERPEVDREWAWLVRKAIREYIERDEKQSAFERDLDKPGIASKRSRKI